MKTIQLIVLCTLLSFTNFSQTVYQVDELRMYSWDDTTVPADWQHDITEQYTYENGGNKETKLVGLSVPELENLYQNIKSYNGNNDIILDVRQFWNSMNLTWNSQSQIVYTYDNVTGYLTVETNQIYNPVTMLFDDSFRELYEYMGPDLVKQTSQTWNGTMWENVEKFEITYTSGLPTGALSSYWDSGSTDWFPPYEEDTATYNGSLLMQVLTEDLNTGDLDRSVYTYTNDLLDMVVFEEWDGAMWVPFDRERNMYDANDNIIELIYEDNSTGSWVGYFKQEKDYSPAGPLSANSFDKDNFNVYPNPVIDVLYLDLKSALSKAANVFLYGMDGRLIKTFDIKTNQRNFEFDLQNVRQGLYFLDIQGANNEKKTLKIIKK